MTRKRRRTRKDCQPYAYPAFYGTYAVGSASPVLRPSGTGPSESPSSPAHPGEGGINAPGVPGGQNSGMGPASMGEDEEFVTGRIPLDFGHAKASGELLGDGRILVDGLEERPSADWTVSVEGSSFVIDSVATLDSGKYVLFLAPV